MTKRNQGILCILSAAFFFALMNLFVRMSEGVPLMEQVFFRNGVALIVSFVMLLASPRKFRTEKENRPYIAIRAVVGTLGVIGNFAAIDHLNIADASMLNKLSPFFAIVFSIWVTKEKPKTIDIIAVFVAFIGALFVVKPGAGLHSYWALLGFSSGLCAGLAYTYVRKIAGREQTSMIVFCFSAFSCALAVPFMIVNFHPMTLHQFVCLMLAGCAATGAQFSITTAYTKAPAKDISVFDYTQVPFAALLGFLFLGQIPDIYSWIGYVIIIGTAFIKWIINSKEDTKQ